MAIIFRLSVNEAAALEAKAAEINAQRVHMGLKVCTETGLLHCILETAIARIQMEPDGEIFLASGEQLNLPL